MTAATLALVTTAGLVVVGAPTAGADDAPQPRTYVVVAHRGDQNEAPENTASAFKTAIAKGAGVIEMDVQFSSSGYPIVMHDLTYDRTTDCAGKVELKTRTQLKACSAGSWFGPAFVKERVPTLGRAFQVIAPSKATRVILHVKITPTDKLAKRIMDDAKKWGMTKRVIILASNNATFKKMTKAGFTTFAYIFASPAGWDKQFQIMIPYDTPLDPAKIDAVHARGGQVWPVENHPEDLRTMLTVGRVDGILANHLKSLYDLLVSSPREIKASKPPKTSAGARRVQHHEDFSDEVTAPPPKRR